MGIHLLGISHHTAPLELREQVAFDPARVPDLLTSICALPDTSEALILSTCNRTEIYYAGDHATPHSLDDWILSNSNRSNELRSCLYRHNESELVKHLCRVASGLDSQILGEPQIFGQLKLAFRVAQDQRTLGSHLYRLFQHAFLVAKRIRTETAIGESATSAASAAVRLALQVFDGFEDQRALMIGAGEMIETAAGHLTTRNIGALTIANRSLERGKKLADKFNARAIALSDIAGLLPHTDLVFSSTASPALIVTAAQIKAAVKNRKRKPLFVVDLAVPRDIDPEAAEFKEVFLYTIDDLHRAVGDNLDARRLAAADAEHIIAEQTAFYGRGIDRMEAVPTIRLLREQTQLTKDQVLAQAQRQLTAGKSPQEVLVWMADALANKILHTPSTELRKAGESSNTAYLEFARRLFGLDDE